MSMLSEYLIYTHSHSHTHREHHVGQGHGTRATPRESQNCKSVLCSNTHTEGRTDEESVQMLDGTWFRCWMCTLQVWTHVFWCQSLFPSLRSCNFPSLSPSGEQMVSIATSQMIFFFVWVSMDIFLGVMFVWEWEIHHLYQCLHHISLFMCALSLGSIFTSLAFKDFKVSVI